VILNLDNCNLRLDEATAEGLAHMDRLTELDLANNPLGLAPYLGYMKGLETLSLNNTGLEVVPPGLFELQRLRLVDLSDNRIVSLPEELFDVDDTQKVIYILRDNPLSESSKKNIADYFDNASLDRQISIQFDSDEALVWGNESDTEASDSGLSDADSDDEGR
jgi:Leucine-rich repeat (LRR) protein